MTRNPVLEIGDGTKGEVLVPLCDIDNSLEDHIGLVGVAFHVAVVLLLILLEGSEFLLGGSEFLAELLLIFAMLVLALGELVVALGELRRKWGRKAGEGRKKRLDAEHMRGKQLERRENSYLFEATNEFVVFEVQAAFQGRKVLGGASDVTLDLLQGLVDSRRLLLLL